MLESALFEVRVIDCQQHIEFKAPLDGSINPLQFSQYVVHESNVTGLTLLEASSYFSNETLCPLTFTLLRNGETYAPATTPCIKIDTNGIVTYLGVLCNEVNFQVKMSTQGGVTALSPVFEVLVQIDPCFSKFVIPSLNPSYLEITSNASSSLG